jgi:hypothetical protein
LAIAKRLAAGDPSNTEWQRDLSVSYEKLGDVAELEGKAAESIAYRQQAINVLSGLDKRGLYLSPEERQRLQRLRP